MAESQPYWLAALAALPALLIPWFQRRSDSIDKREEREAAERARLREMMDTQTLAAFTRLERDLDRARARVELLEGQNDALERDRDRGWNLARSWRQRARDMRHEAMNARQVAIGRLRPDEAVPWQDIPPLPELEAISTD